MDKKLFVAELAKLRPSATFLHLKKYRNEWGEIADYSIVFHMSYENSLKRSVATLKEIAPQSKVETRAKQELLDSYQDSLKKIASTPIEKINDEYTRFFDEKGQYIKGVKLHTASCTLHLYGLIVQKKVYVAGGYPLHNKEELTVVKDRFRRMCDANRFRQFRILPHQVERITVEHLDILIK
jgi:hypothetical protein